MPRAVLIMPLRCPCFPPYSHSHVDREIVVNAVQHFLQSCQPFFNKLEAVARDAAFKSNALPYNVFTMVVFFYF